MRTAKDYPVGSVFDLGTVETDERTMVEFARQHDPQGIHVDRQQAIDAGFDDVIASGWYVCSLFMRQFVTRVINDSTALVSPGVDTIRWVQPLRPNTSVRGTAEVTKVIPSFGRPGARIATFGADLRAEDKRIATLSLHCLFAQ